MIIVLSPAKTLDYSVTTPENHTAPQFLSQSAQLIKTLKAKEPKDIALLMGLSDKLATLNFDRYQSWSATKSASAEAKPSLFVFKGDVYQGLKADEFSKTDIKFAQKHLRILSGLYGILRPLDVMKPYRLEMGTKLQTNNASNLYQFWGDKIQSNIIRELEEQKSNLLVNLASKEYFTVLGKIPAEVNVISPVFKDQKNGQYKIISFYAKKVRGTMTNWLVKNKIKNAKDITQFAEDGYYYSKELSSPQEPVFLRD